MRFLDSQVTSSNAELLNLINCKDLEWLAWNWRLDKQAEEFGSRKQIVFENFNRTVPMLPSPKEIVHGIILAQLDYYASLPQRVNYNTEVELKAKIWKRIF